MILTKWQFQQYFENQYKNKFNMSDWTYVVFGLSSIVCQNLIYGLTRFLSLFYIGAIISSGSHIVVPVYRKLLAERVPEKYLGALFAIPAWIEAGGSAIGGLIYSTLYKIDPFNARWLFWGFSNVMMVLAFISTFCAWYFKRFLPSLQPESSQQDENNSKI